MEGGRGRNGEGKEIGVEEEEEEGRSLVKFVGQTASNMMICGEDLGNVPPEVFFLLPPLPLLPSLSPIPSHLLFSAHPPPTTLTITLGSSRTSGTWCAGIENPTVSGKSSKHVEVTGFYKLVRWTYVEVRLSFRRW